MEYHFSTGLFQAFYELPAFTSSLAAVSQTNVQPRKNIVALDKLRAQAAAKFVHSAHSIKAVD